MGEYIKIVSWHVILTPTRVPNRYVTLCGRRATGHTSPVLPAEKSCETCLRLEARRDDREDNPDVVDVPAT